MTVMSRIPRLDISAQACRLLWVAVFYEAWRAAHGKISDASNPSAKRQQHRGARSWVGSRGFYQCGELAGLSDSTLDELAALYRAGRSGDNLVSMNFVRVEPESCLDAVGW